MPGDNPRLLEALPKKDHFHCPLKVLVFSSETLLFGLSNILCVFILVFLLVVLRNLGFG